MITPMSSSFEEPLPRGAGPVATVYKVTPSNGGQPGAIKVYPGPLDRALYSELLDEQRTLAGLRRVSSILLYDGIEQRPDGRAAIRMELCARSLADLVEVTGPVPVPEVIGLAETITGVLVDAHAVGIVHGGVTPFNVLYRLAGQPVLADFGLGLRQSFTRAPESAAAYTAPEVLRGAEPTESADLYGLGAVLYLALTGWAPFSSRPGEPAEEVLLRALGETPLIVRRDLPAPLTELVAALLAKSPDERPGSAEQVLERLGTLHPPATPHPAFAPPAGWQPPGSTGHTGSAPPTPSAPSPASAPAEPAPPVASPAGPAPAVLDTPMARQPAPTPPNVLTPADVAPSGVPAPDVPAPDVPAPGVPAAGVPTSLPTATPASPSPTPSGPSQAYLPSPTSLSPQDGPPTGPMPGPAPTHSPRQRSRKEGSGRRWQSHPLLLTAPAMVAVLAVLFGVLGGGGDTERSTAAGNPDASDDQPPENAAAPGREHSPPADSANAGDVEKTDPPAPDAPPSTEPPDPGSVDLEIHRVRDNGSEVELAWRSDEPLTYAVFVAEQGGDSASANYRGPGTTLTLPIKPDLKYCFQVQGTDGTSTFESSPRGIRGANCRS